MPQLKPLLLFVFVQFPPFLHGKSLLSNAFPLNIMSACIPLKEVVKHVLSTISKMSVMVSSGFHT